MTSAERLRRDPQLPAHRRRVTGAAALALATLWLAGCGSDVSPAVGTLPPIESSAPPNTATSDAPTTSGPTTTAPEPGPDTTPAPSTLPEPGDALAALDAAWERWLAAGIETYEWQTVTYCFCPEPAPVLTRVLGGRVVGSPDDYLLVSVDQLFERLRDEIAAGGAVDVTYDAELGYPTHIDADPIREAVDDEYTFDASQFAQVTDPIERWFTESHPCGYGFQVGTPDQVAGLFVWVHDATPTPIAAGTFDLADLPSVELRFGRDLFANWCDDVIAPGEAVAVTDETWGVASGSIDVSFESEQVAVGSVGDLVVTAPDGRQVALGSPMLRNDGWGFFAG